MAGAPDALQQVRQRIACYYGTKIATHGPTPRGVDWSCLPTQQLRFIQLLRVCEFSGPFSLNDIGCGYGALLEFLRQRHRGTRVDYLGVDLSEEMVAAARTLWSGRRRAKFHCGADTPRHADYSVASGIFNVRIDEPLVLWQEFITQTLRQMAQTSTRGFAVNFLAKLPVGIEGTRELYRTEPGPWADFCRREFGANVTVLDSYGMREFTLLVWTEPRRALPAASARSSSPR